VAFSPDGTRLATASADKTAQVWEVTTGKRLYLLKGHTAPVIAVAFSPEGKCGAMDRVDGSQVEGTCIATASADRTVRLWDSRSGLELFFIAGYAVPVTAVAFSQDGGRLDTVSVDATVRSYALSITDLMAEATKRVCTSLSSFEEDDKRRCATYSSPHFSLGKRESR
jgi:WD40 repeat protein